MARRGRKALGCGFRREDGVGGGMMSWGIFKNPSPRRMPGPSASDATCPKVAGSRLSPGRRPWGGMTSGGTRTRRPGARRGPAPLARRGRKSLGPGFRRDDGRGGGVTSWGSSRTRRPGARRGPAPLARRGRESLGPGFRRHDGRGGGVTSWGELREPVAPDHAEAQRLWRDVTESRWVPAFAGTMARGSARINPESRIPNPESPPNGYRPSAPAGRSPGVGCRGASRA
jgi:hypothetical protein